MIRTPLVVAYRRRDESFGPLLIARSSGIERISADPVREYRGFGPIFANCGGGRGFRAPRARNPPFCGGRQLPWTAGGRRLAPAEECFGGAEWEGSGRGTGGCCL